MRYLALSAMIVLPCKYQLTRLFSTYVLVNFLTYGTEGYWFEPSGVY